MWYEVGVSLPLWQRALGWSFQGTEDEAVDPEKPFVLWVKAWLSCPHHGGINGPLVWCWRFSGGASGKDPACQCRRHNRRGFSPWVGKMPWSRKWQPSPVFLPGKFHRQRSLAGYGMVHRVGCDWAQFYVSCPRHLGFLGFSLEENKKI